MKKVFGLFALLALLLASSALAQDKTIGIYFDTAGTVNNLTKTYTWGGPNPVVTNAYVIAFAEMVVGGAAFKLDKDPKIIFVGATYPAGIQIGDILTGIEIGLTQPLIGYYGNPVRLATIMLYPGWQPFTDASMCIVPWEGHYPEVILSDQNGILYPATGLCGYMSVIVPDDVTSWGAVKELYK